MKPISRRTLLKPTIDRGAPATVTVIIPCYNYARYLPDAVGSVLSQTGVIVDVVIVDDASTDNSLDTAHQLAAGDARITIVSHPRNAGPVETFNDGLRIARGEFLVRLDADDLLTPASLERSVAVMRQFPSVGLVYGHPLHFSGGDLPAHRARATAWTVWPGREWLADRCRTAFNVITSPEVLMRRCVVDQVGGQMPLAHTHDMEMWLRMSAFSDVAYIKGADQAWHREHNQSLSAREVDGFRDLLERRAAFETLFAGSAGALPESAALRSAATRALASHSIEVAKRRYDHVKVDRDLVAALRDFARELVPDVERIPGWRGLDRRAAIGPGPAARHPVFFLERVARGLRDAWRRRRWHRAGY